MSDDDLMRRGDVRDFLMQRLDCALAKRGIPAHRAMTDAVLADVVPALPADPRAAAAGDVCRDLAALLRSEPFPTSDVRWAMLQRRAEAAWRSLAKPEPAKCQQLPSSSHEASVPSNNSEPAPERCPEPGCVGGVVSFPCGSLPCNDPECVKLPCPRCAKGGAP